MANPIPMRRLTPVISATRPRSVPSNAVSLHRRLRRRQLKKIANLGPDRGQFRMIGLIGRIATARARAIELDDAPALEGRPVDAANNGLALGTTLQLTNGKTIKWQPDVGDIKPWEAISGNPSE